MASSIKLCTGASGRLGSTRSSSRSSRQPEQRGGAGRPMRASRMLAKASSTEPQAASSSSPATAPATASSASRPRSSSSIPSTSNLANADTKAMRAVPSPYHPVDTSSYDLNLSHYKIPLLRFLSPPVVIGTGIIFIVAANLMEGEGGFSLAVTAEAAVPVIMWWFVLLHVLPGAFRRFAQQYMETHEFVPASPNDPAQQQQQQQQQGGSSASASGWGSSTHEKE